MKQTSGIIKKETKNKTAEKHILLLYKSLVKPPLGYYPRFLFLPSQRGQKQKQHAQGPGLFGGRSGFLKEGAKQAQLPAWRGEVRGFVLPACTGTGSGEPVFTPGVADLRHNQPKSSSRKFEANQKNIFTCTAEGNGGTPFLQRMGSIVPMQEDTS